MRTATLRAGTRTIIIVAQKENLVATRVLFPFIAPEGFDLTPNTAFIDSPEFETHSKGPSIEMLNLGESINKVCELMLFAEASRGAFQNSEMALGSASQEFLKHVYKLRGNFQHADGFEAADATTQVAIVHGSFGQGQPFQSTLTNTLSMLRIRPGFTPWKVELVYCPGGGAALQVTEIGTITPDDGGWHLELVVNYPNAVLQGFLNGKLIGEAPMTGWNGTRLPNLNALGKRALMSLLVATGAGPDAITWYNWWTGLEMEIPLKVAT